MIAFECWRAFGGDKTLAIIYAHLPNLHFFEPCSFSISHQRNKVCDNSII